MKKILLFSVVVFIFSSCSRKEKATVNPFNDPILFAKTVKELNNVVMENNFSPIVASRNYAYASIAAYETISLTDPRFPTFSGRLKQLTPLPRLDTNGVNIPYASLLAFCKVGQSVTFPEGSMKTYVAKLDSMAAESMDKEEIDKSKNLADVVAKHIIDWSKGDYYTQTRTAEKYEVKNEEGRWVPTPPAYMEAVEPHWDMIRPMVMDSADQFVPPAPPAFNVKDTSSKYYKEVMLIKNAIDSLTPEQKHIADFWDDLGTRTIVKGHVSFLKKKFSPTGHWMNIVGIAAEKDKADFGTTVYAYALTSISMFDAFIQCWDEKYRDNTVRPETVINKYFDPEWRPFLETPPFPEYTCGHSTISSAAAEALTSVFGDNFAYTDTSELEFNIPSRSFPSFRAAAIENNWARFYGGIHYHNSCIISNEYGKKVGDLVADKLKSSISKKIN